VQSKSTPQKIDFEGALHTRGAYFHAFHTNGQVGRTCVGPPKLRWPRAPRSLNPSLTVTPLNTLKWIKKALLQLIFVISVCHMQLKTFGVSFWQHASAEFHRPLGQQSYRARKIIMKRIFKKLSTAVERCHACVVSQIAWGRPSVISVCNRLFCRAGLHNSESSKGKIVLHTFAAGRKSLFRCSVEEILKEQLIIRSRAFSTFSAIEKDLAGRKKWPAGRMLFKPVAECNSNAMALQQCSGTKRNGSRAMIEQLLTRSYRSFKSWRRKYSFRGQDFCFYCMLKQIVLSTTQFGRQKDYGVMPLNVTRGYDPAPDPSRFICPKRIMWRHYPSTIFLSGYGKLKGR